MDLPVGAAGFGLASTQLSTLDGAASTQLGTLDGVAARFKRWRSEGSAGVGAGVPGVAPRGVMRAPIGSVGVAAIGNFAAGSAIAALGSS